jgi:hypothetical protein
MTAAAAPQVVISLNGLPQNDRAARPASPYHGSRYPLALSAARLGPYPLARPYLAGIRPNALTPRAAWPDGLLSWGSKVRAISDKPFYFPSAYSPIYILTLSIRCARNYQTLFFDDGDMYQGQGHWMTGIIQWQGTQGRQGKGLMIARNKKNRESSRSVEREIISLICPV